MDYAAAVTALTRIRSQRAEFQTLGIGTLEDGYLATLIWGPVLTVGAPLTGAGGFAIDPPPADMPDRVGNRPDAGVAASAWLHDRGLRAMRPALIESLYRTRSIDTRAVPMWLRKPFDVNTAPVTDAYKAAYSAIWNLWSEAAARNILPADMWRTMLKIKAGGFILFPRAVATAIPGMTDAQGRAFAEFSRQVAPIASLAAKDQLAQVAADGKILAGKADFWTAVERVTKAVATLGTSEIGRGSPVGLVIAGVIGAAALFMLGRGKK